MKDELLNKICGVWEATAVDMQRSAAKAKGETLHVMLAKADILWYCAGQIRNELNVKAGLIASSRRVAARMLNKVKARAEGGKKC